jgi:hypothetical protein
MEPCSVADTSVRLYLCSAKEARPLSHVHLFCEASLARWQRRCGGKVKRFIHSWSGLRESNGRRLSKLEFETLLEQADPTRACVQKKIWCFLWRNRYYELNEFIVPHKSMLVLKTETASDQQPIIVPPFLQPTDEARPELSCKDLLTPLLDNQQV